METRASSVLAVTSGVIDTVTLGAGSQCLPESQEAAVTPWAVVAAAAAHSVAADAAADLADAEVDTAKQVTGLDGRAPLKVAVAALIDETAAAVRVVDVGCTAQQMAGLWGCLSSEIAVAAASPVDPAAFDTAAARMAADCEAAVDAWTQVADCEGLASWEAVAAASIGEAAAWAVDVAAARNTVVVRKVDARKQVGAAASNAAAALGFWDLAAAASNPPVSAAE